MVNPKCLNHGKEYGWNVEGYLLPCCWYDTRDEYKKEVDYLMQDKLNITNNTSIDDIINSEEWKFFYKNLENYKCCKKFCSLSSTLHKKIVHET